MDHTFSLNRTEDKSMSLCNETGSNASELTVFSFLLCLFIAVLSVLITCGNFLVITTIVYFKQLHTPTNYLVLSLAVADLLVGVFLLPLSTVLYVRACWNFRGLLCKIRSAFDLFLSVCSILNLCSIAVDRYYVVCEPLTYTSKITARVARMMILMTWTISALLGILITVRATDERQTSYRCKLFQNTKTTLLGAFVGFYMPAFVILSLYTKVLAVARRQALSIQRTMYGVKINRVETKATKTLFIVVGAFLICWTPFIFSVSSHSLTNYSVPSLLLETMKWLGWSNSMLNPFIYAFFYSWFRRCFKMILSGKLFFADYSNSKLF